MSGNTSLKSSRDRESHPEKGGKGRVGRVGFGAGKPGQPPDAALPAAPGRLPPAGLQGCRRLSCELAGRGPRTCALCIWRRSWDPTDPQGIEARARQLAREPPWGGRQARGQADPVQPLRLVVTRLRSPLVTCLQRSICAPRLGPRATFDGVCVDSMSD